MSLDNHNTARSDAAHIACTEVVRSVLGEGLSCSNVGESHLGCKLGQQCLDPLSRETFVGPSGSIPECMIGLQSG